MFEAILGLVMIYSWIHGVIIVCKHIKGTTQYENAVMIVAVVGFALLVIGTLN
jgi:hypothetical protein